MYSTQQLSQFSLVRVTPTLSTKGGAESSRNRAEPRQGITAWLLYMSQFRLHEGRRNQPYLRPTLKLAILIIPIIRCGLRRNKTLPGRLQQA